jgi:hypothetical protein
VDSFLSGVATENLWVGGDVNDPVHTSPFFTDGQHVYIGQNGQVFILDADGNEKGFLGVLELDPINITGAVNNGSGLIRLKTATAHGMERGDTAKVVDVGGVPNATGSWPVTIVDATHVDLNASVWGGSYTGGGVLTPYYAGIHTETAAIGGTGFPDSLFRAYADGHLRIGLASGPHMEVDSDGSLMIGTTGGPRIEIDSGTGNITLVDAALSFDFAGGAGTIQIDSANFIKITGPTFVSQLRDDTLFIQLKTDASRHVQLTYQSFNLNYGPGPHDGGVVFNASNIGGNGAIYNSLGVQAIVFSGNSGQVDAHGGFVVNGAVGVGGTSTFLTNVIPTTATIQYKDWTGVNQSMTVVTAISLSSASNIFTGGLRTA